MQIEELANHIIIAETEFGKTGKPVLDIEKYVAKRLTEKGYRKVVMCKDCAYCEEHHYEQEGEKPYIKLTCKWSSYAHQPKDFCSMAKMKGN